MTKKDYQLERLDICKSCEHLKRPFGIMQCDICNCVMIVKTAIKNSECPIKKWVAEN
jgi:hypothetical protein